MADDYERRAREAERMAALAKEPQERLAHAQVAHIWRELAARRKAGKPVKED